MHLSEPLELDPASLLHVAWAASWRRRVVCFFIQVPVDEFVDAFGRLFQVRLDVGSIVGGDMVNERASPCPVHSADYLHSWKTARNLPGHQLLWRLGGFAVAEGSRGAVPSLRTPKRTPPLVRVPLPKVA